MRSNPLYHWFENRQPKWKSVFGMPMAVTLAGDDEERSAAGSLELCDVSALPKIGLKGPDASAALAALDIEIPAAVYHSRRLTDGGYIVRLGLEEFFLESGLSADIVPRIAARDFSQENVIRTERQECTILLSGPGSADLMAQVCGMNTRAIDFGTLALTRIAGVNAAILAESAEIDFRIWVDYTYAVYLWETMVGICEELGGRVIGAGRIFPELR